MWSGQLVPETRFEPNTVPPAYIRFDRRRRDCAEVKVIQVKEREVTK